MSGCVEWEGVAQVTRSEIPFAPHTHTHSAMTSDTSCARVSFSVRPARNRGKGRNTQHTDGSQFSSV
jgi:hypothetical protein